MSYTVLIDTKENPPTLSETSRGWRATRAAIIKGFETDPETLSVSERLDIALSLPEVPSIGDSYPVAGTPIWCIDRAATLIDRNIVRIVLTYGVEDYDLGTPLPGEPPLIEIGVVTELVTTNQEYTADGIEQIVLQHEKVIDDLVGGTSTPVGIVNSYPEVQVPVPRPYMRFSLTETSVSSYFHLVGTVNANSWSYPASARKWYFGSLEQRSSDGGYNYQTHYAFYYNDDTWDKRIVFLDDETGQIPGDLIEGQGTRLARVRKEGDWGDLPNWAPYIT